MVRMASKLTFGINTADWQQRINTDRMRQERAKKARDVMREHGIPALLATRADNLRYLTGLRGPEFMPQLWYVLFFAEHDPVVFAHAGWKHAYASQAPWIKEWRVARAWLAGACGGAAAEEEAQIFAADIRAELEQRGLARERLGTVAIDGFGMRALTGAGQVLVDAWPLMLEARASKTEDEISCLKMAFAIADVAWFKTWQGLEPGIRDTDVTRIASEAAYAAGADEVPPLNFRAGPLAFDRTYERTSRIMQYGELGYGTFCGITYMGYKTCSYRTFIIGRQPNQKERDWYQRLLDRINNVILAIKPGATTADAAQHFPPATTWGYREEAEVLTAEIGHGVGLYQYEYPIINRQWSLKHPQVFEPGMTIAIEGREGEVGVGGVRLEDVVVVTKDGAELIDHFPRDEILVAPFGAA